MPSPVVEEADYIPYEDAVSSDGEVPRCDDMQQQMAEMRREMEAMHNLVHVMASTTAQPIVCSSTAKEQQTAGPSSATIQPITGPSTSAAQPVAAPSTGVGIVGFSTDNTEIRPGYSPICHPAGPSALTNVADSLLTNALSDLTRRSYQASIDRFNTFCISQLQLVTCFPAEISAVVSFIASLFQSGYASATIATNLSAISFVHKVNGIGDPTSAFVIKKLLHGASKLRPSVDYRAPSLRKFYTR